MARPSRITGRWAAATLLAMAAAIPSHAWAWGQDGHVIVARIAERHLSARARQALVPLLQGRRLADLASWADDWRDTHSDTSPWHFVDVPLQIGRASCRERV